MRLSETLCNIIGPSGFVSITGSGGKTTLMCLLQKRFLEDGRTVLLTTTTKVQREHEWNVSAVCQRADEISQGAQSVLLASPYGEGKLCFAGDEELEKASLMFDITLCEADGSRGLPVKIHTDRDPVIHRKSTLTIAVFGCSAIGKRTEGTVFGETSFEYVDLAFMQRLFSDPQGIMKGKPSVVVMNQSESLTQTQKSILEKMEYPKGLTVLFASALSDEIYWRKD